MVKSFSLVLLNVNYNKARTNGICVINHQLIVVQEVNVFGSLSTSPIHRMIAFWGTC